MCRTLLCRALCTLLLPAAASMHTGQPQGLQQPQQRPRRVAGMLVVQRTLLLLHA
jgi:hypothetical protein